MDTPRLPIGPEGEPDPHGNCRGGDPTRPPSASGKTDDLSKLCAKSHQSFLKTQSAMKGNPNMITTLLKYNDVHCYWISILNKYTLSKYTITFSISITTNT